MSKISEKLLQQQADEFEIELNYQEWLMYNVEEPTYNETTGTEQEYLTIKCLY